MKVLVVGGSRFIGYHIVRELVKEGMEVSVFNRGIHQAPFPPQVEQLRGDRNNESDIKDLTQRNFDVVVDTCALLPHQTEKIIHFFAGRVKHFVHCSSGACYGQSDIFPWSEDGPNTFGPRSLFGEYAINKLECERILLKAHKEKDFPVSMVRPPYVLGPRNYADRERFIINRLLAKEPILIPEDGQAIIQFIDVEDLAHIFVSIIHHKDKAIGQIYNGGGKECATLVGLVQLHADMLKIKPDIIYVDKVDYAKEGVAFRFDDHIFPFPNRHYILDMTKAKEHLEISKFIPLSEILIRYHQWYKQEPAEHQWERYPKERTALQKIN